MHEYKRYEENVLNNLIGSGNKGSAPEEVAYTIYKAATDKKRRLRYPAGKSRELVYFRRLLPFSIYQSLTRLTMEK